jgi:L-lactate permease
MDLLREILSRLLLFLQGYAQWWGRAVAAVSEEFDLGLAPEMAQIIGVVIGFLVLIAFVRRLTKWDPKGNQPQSFPLKTAETPNQVVAKDREKFLMMLLRVTLFVLLIVAVLTSR